MGGGNSAGLGCDHASHRAYVRRRGEDGELSLGSCAGTNDLLDTEQRGLALEFAGYFTELVERTQDLAADRGRRCVGAEDARLQAVAD